MNYEWAEIKLEEYLKLCEAVRSATEFEMWNAKATRLNDQAELMLYTVEQILLALDPHDNERMRPPSYGSKHEERVRRALGALRSREEVEKHLAPTSPELPADQLHPTVWMAASVLWDTGQYRVAVGQAALALATKIKVKAQSKLNDRKLVQDVFSTNPPKADAAKLHVSGARDDEAWKRRQEGLQLLAQGAYAGIRNVSAHEDEEWSEQQALEYLAVFSVVARWFEETELKTAEEAG